MSILAGSHVAQTERELRGWQWLWAGVQGPNVAPPPQVAQLVTRQEQPWHPGSWLWHGHEPVVPPIVLPAVERAVIGRQEQPWHPSSWLWHGTEPFTPPVTLPAVTRELLTRQEQPAHPGPWLWHGGEPAAPIAQPVPPLRRDFLGRQEQPFHPGSLLFIPPSLSPFVPSPGPNIPPVPVSKPMAQWAVWITEIARTLNLVLGGKNNSTTTVTLAANASSTVLFDSRVGAGSYVQLAPRTPSAAAALASGQVYTIQSLGQATICHPASSAIDQTFSVLIVG